MYTYVCVYYPVDPDSYTVVAWGLADLLDTNPVIRAIGVSHKASKDEFRQNIRSHSWSVFSFLLYYMRVPNDISTPRVRADSSS